MLKKVSIALAGLLLGAHAANAADVAPAASDWTGFYIGVNGGYGGGTFDYPMNLKVTDYSVTPQQVLLDYDFGVNNTASGFFGGGQIGYNYQMDNFVLGIEGDFSGTNIKSNLEVYSDTANASVSGKGELDWFATARLRAGYSVTPDLLIYGTGGLAWGSFTSSYKADLASLGSLSDSTTNSHMGWTLGGGFEYAVTEHVSLKTEYLYVDLGEQNVFSRDLLAGADLGGSAVLKIKEDVAVQTVKAGINYRF